MYDIVRTCIGRERRRDKVCSCPDRPEEHMDQSQNIPPSNRLIAALAESDRELLEPHLSFVEVALKQELEAQDQPIEHVYFPENGMISNVTSRANDQTEVGLTGREG